MTKIVPKNTSPVKLGDKESSMLNRIVARPGLLNCDTQYGSWKAACTRLEKKSFIEIRYEHKDAGTRGAFMYPTPAGIAALNGHRASLQPPASDATPEPTVDDARAAMTASERMRLGRDDYQRLQKTESVPAPEPKPAVSDYTLLAQVNAHYIMTRKDDLQDMSDFNALNILNQLEALWDFAGKLAESNLKQAEQIATLTAKIDAITAGAR